MQRKAVRLFGLVLVGAAAFSVLRRVLRRGDRDPIDPPQSRPPLASVPDPGQPPTGTPTSDSAPELPVESTAPAAADPEPEPESQPDLDLDPEPESRQDVGPAPSSWVSPVDDDCPTGYPIKVNERSGIYHVPGGLSYDRTRPTRCYPDEASAEADGFRRAKR